MDCFWGSPWYKYNVKLDSLAITKTRFYLIRIVSRDPKLVHKDVVACIISGNETISLLDIVPFHGADDMIVQVRRMVKWHKRWHDEILSEGWDAADPICYNVHAPRWAPKF